MARKKIDYASLFTLRKDGRYMGYWRDKKDVRHAIYDRDPETLYKKIQEKESAPEKPITFQELAERWEVSHVEKLARSTQATYKAPLVSLKKELGDTPVTEITPDVVNNILLQEKKRGYSYKHAAAKKSILKQILDEAILDKDIPVSVNAASAVTVPRGMKKGHIEAPEKDIVAVITENLDKPFGDFAAMLLYTGMRTEEAVALTWADIGESYIYVSKAVDLHGTPILKEAKTEAGERAVPILDKHRPFLHKPKGAKPTDYLFNDEGKLLTRGQISSKWLTWCKAAGLAYQKQYDNRHRGARVCSRVEWRPLITPHKLRHHYATILFEQKVSELTAQKIIGHKDIHTTHQIYTSLRQKYLDDEVSKINAGF